MFLKGFKKFEKHLHNKILQKKCVNIFKTSIENMAKIKIKKELKKKIRYNEQNQLKIHSILKWTFIKKIKISKKKTAPTKKSKKH